MKITGVHICIVIALAVLALVVYGTVRFQGQPAPAATATAPPSPPVPEHTAAPEGTLPPVQQPADAVAVLEITPSPTLDLGLIPRDTPGKGEIKLTNKGKADLEILEVRSSCGCTKATIDEAKKHIPPGSTSVVEVSVDPHKVFGFESTKTVTIRSNDPVHPSSNISVTAKVDPEFQVEPTELKFGKLRKGELAEQTMVLRQLCDEPIELLEVKNMNRDQNFQFSFEKRPEAEWAKPNKAEYAIKARVADDAPLGPVSARFGLKTTCKRVETLWCTASADLASFYTISPNRALILRTMPQPGQSNKQSVTVVSPDKPFEITNIETSNTAFDVTTEPGNVPNSTVINVALKGNAVASPQQNDYVKFIVKAADESAKERIQIRVLGAPPTVRPNAGTAPDAFAGTAPRLMPPASTAFGAARAAMHKQISLQKQFAITPPPPVAPKQVVKAPAPAK